MPTLTYNRPTKQDLPQLVSLLEQLFGIEEDFVFDPDKQLRGLKMLLDRDNAHVIVAKQEEEVVGMATGQLLISTAEGSFSLLVEDVVVQERFQKKGVGRNLLIHLQSWALEQEATRMQLLADLENPDAFSFYEKCGWSRTQLICLRKMITNHL